MDDTLVNGSPTFAQALGAILLRSGLASQEVNALLRAACAPPEPSFDSRHSLHATHEEVEIRWLPVTQRDSRDGAKGVIETIKVSRRRRAPSQLVDTYA